MFANHLFLPANHDVSFNQQNFQDFTYRENFPTPEIQTMGTYDTVDFPKDNFQLKENDPRTNYIFGYDPNEIVERTNLRPEAAEFVPRYSTNVPLVSVPSSEIPRTRFETINDYGSALNSNLNFSAQSPQVFNNTNYIGEQRGQSSQNLNIQGSLDSNNKTFSVEAPEFIPRTFNNVHKVSLTTNINVEHAVANTFEGKESISNLYLPQNSNEYNTVVRVETKDDYPSTSREGVFNKNNNFHIREEHSTKEYHKYNEDVEKNDRNYQQRNKIRNSQSSMERNRVDETSKYKQQYATTYRQENGEEKSTKEYHKYNEDVEKNDGNYQQRNKIQNSQSSMERNRVDDTSKYKQQYATTYRQENGSSHQSHENDYRQSRRYSDRTENKSRYSRYDNRRSNNPSPPRFRRQHQEVPDKRGSTTEVHSVDYEEHYRNTKEIRYYKNDEQARHNNSTNINTDVDEDGCKRRWSERSVGSDRSFENKKSDLELETTKSNEEKSPKSKNQKLGKESTKYVQVDKRQYQKTDIENKDFGKSTSYSADFSSEQQLSKGHRRSLDRSKSLRDYRYGVNDEHSEGNNYEADDDFLRNKSQKKPLGYSRSFKEQHTEKESARTFRDALFAEKKSSEKYRDLKQERNGLKKAPEYQWNEEFKNRRSSGDFSIEHLFDKKYAEHDVEYRAFLQELQINKTPKTVNIKEHNQDLFQMPKEYSLAHCVSEDMRMGSGIAVTFRNNFKSVESLLNAHQKRGGVAVLKENLVNDCRFLYYLVTKRKSRDKPTYKDFWCSVQMLRNHIERHNVKKLAIPKLGCGLDRLDWPTVKHIIDFLFRKINIEIIVCNFQQNEDSMQKSVSYSIEIQYKNEQLVNTKEPVVLYFTTLDSHISDEMIELEDRFKFLNDFKKCPKGYGVIVPVITNNCFLCGCVVRKTVNNDFDFKSFYLCLSKINDLLAKKSYTSLAISMVKDQNDDLLFHKVITLLLNYLQNVVVYVYTGEFDVSFDET